jgi:transcriptional regulator with XRE-family HTH domain
MAGKKIPLTWGRKIETLRVLRGWSQSALAEAAGVAQSSLSEYESGKEPTETVRNRVEEALGLGALTQTAYGLLDWMLQRMEGRWRATAWEEEEQLIEEGVEEMSRMFEATLRSGVSKILGMGKIEGEEDGDDPEDEDETLLDFMAAAPPLPRRRKALAALYKSRRPPEEKA